MPAGRLMGLRQGWDRRLAPSSSFDGSGGCLLCFDSGIQKPEAEQATLTSPADPSFPPPGHVPREAACRDEAPVLPAGLSPWETLEADWRAGAERGRLGCFRPAPPAWLMLARPFPPPLPARGHWLPPCPSLDASPSLSVPGTPPSLQKHPDTFLRELWGRLLSCRDHAGQRGDHQTTGAVTSRLKARTAHVCTVGDPLESPPQRHECYGKVTGRPGLLLQGGEVCRHGSLSGAQRLRSHRGGRASEA